MMEIWVFCLGNFLWISWIVLRLLLYKSLSKTKLNSTQACWRTKKQQNINAASEHSPIPFRFLDISLGVQKVNIFFGKPICTSQLGRQRITSFAFLPLGTRWGWFWRMVQIRVRALRARRARSPRRRPVRPRGPVEPVTRKGPVGRARKARKRP